MQVGVGNFLRENMNTIPSETLKQIVSLRAENGLEASESALQSDIDKTKAKWTLNETARYRRAGRSPVFISGKYLTATGSCPLTGEKDGQSSKQPSKGDKDSNGKVPKPDETAFYKVLHGKGFPVKLSHNLLTGDLETELPSSISRHDLKFGAIPANAGGVYVTQTTPQIQVTMPLDKFLELAGIKA